MVSVTVTVMATVTVTVTVMVTVTVIMVSRDDHASVTLNQSRSRWFHVTSRLHDRSVIFTVSFLTTIGKVNAQKIHAFTTVRERSHDTERYGVLK